MFSKPPRRVNAGWLTGAFTRLLGWQRSLKVGLALLFGALQAASLAWPFAMLEMLGWTTPNRGQPLWWLQILSMAALVGMLGRCRRARDAAWLGWFFALAWLSLTFGWLYTSMHVYGGLNAALAVVAVLALAALLALYYAVPCWIFWALAQTNQARAALLFASLWLLAELARGQWLTGFGWGAAGYAHIDGPLQNVLPWLGAYGAGWVAAAFAALLAMIFGPGQLLEKVVVIAGGAVCLLLVTLLPPPTGSTQATLKVALLQGNIAQEEKFQPATGVVRALRWYGERLQDARVDLVITPETALAVLPDQLPEGYWAALQRRFSQGKQAALVGIPLGSYEEGYTNSVVGLQPGQAAPWRYDKHHLVPFGEFIPPLFRWFTNLMQIPLGDFNRGALPQPTFDWRGQRLAVTICYENLFSEELATQFVDATKAPTILVNISNLGWFGEHLAMDQHLQIARVRALEFDRPFLLATNTGQTAIVDHRGVVTHQLAAHTAAVLQGEVRGQTAITPYAYWAARWGQWPLWLFALLLVSMATLRRQSCHTVGWHRGWPNRRASSLGETAISPEHVALPVVGLITSEVDTPGTEKPGGRSHCQATERCAGFPHPGP